MCSTSPAGDEVKLLERHSAAGFGGPATSLSARSHLTASSIEWQGGFGAAWNAGTRLPGQSAMSCYTHALAGGSLQSVSCSNIVHVSLCRTELTTSTALAGSDTAGDCSHRLNSWPSMCGWLGLRREQIEPGER